MAVYLMLSDLDDDDYEDAAEYLLSLTPGRLVGGGLRRVKGPNELLGVLALSTPLPEAPTPPDPREQR